MADVVGLAAAGGQFIEQSIKIVKLSKEIYDKIQDAPAEIKAWRGEVEGLQALIKSIESTPALQQRESLKPIVDQCKDAGIELAAVFDKIDFAKTDAFGRRTWKVIGGLAREDEITKLFATIERLKSTLNTEIALATLNQGEATLKEVKRSFQPGSDEEKCLQSLFVTDSVSDREGIITAKGHRTPSTCEWIAKTEEYQSWEASQSSLLWISGPPGKGKTYISIFLTQLLEASKSDTTVISFFCNNQVAARNTAVNILRGLMTQLCTRHEHLLSCIIPTWKIQNDTLFKDSSFETLWRIFASMLEALKNNEVICILDALDECSEPSMSSLVFKLKALFHSNEPKPTRKNMKLILVSREQPQSLPEALSAFPHVTIDAAKQDVKLYITEKVAELAREKSIEKTELYHHIEKIFQERSEDTFLWVSLMVEELKQKTIDEIENTLDQLPRGLEAVYERIISQINANEKQHIAEMLTWITLAKYPLQVKSICEAINVKPTDKLSREQICMGYIRSCKSLLELSSEKSHGGDGDFRVSLLHQSVKDFLLRQPPNTNYRGLVINQRQGHQMISTRLVQYLAVVGVEKQPKTFPSRETSLYFYAKYHWYSHMREIGDEFMAVVKENKDFFCTRSISRDKWWKHRYPYRGPFRDVPLLHVACSTGLLHLAKWILLKRHTLFGLSRKREINRAWGRNKIAPLHLAVEENHASIVHLLLEYGADPSDSNDYGETSLHCALGAQAPAVFHTLLATGGGKKIAQREAKHPREWDSLLHLAAKHGQEAICFTLVETYNHDINAKDIIGRTPLHEAVNAGHVNLAKTLVSRFGAKIVSEQRLLRDVFHHHHRQTQQDFHSAVEFVTHDLKININVTNDEGNTVFHEGINCWAGLSQALTLGADLKARNLDGETVMHCQPIHYFSFPELLFILHQGSIDINAQDNRGRTPLHAYTYKAPWSLFHINEFRESFTNNVLNLLDLGADRSLRDMAGNTPSSALVKSREERLERIADTDDEDKEDMTSEISSMEPVFSEVMNILENYETAPIDPAAIPPSISQLSEWAAENEDEFY